MDLTHPIEIDLIDGIQPVQNLPALPPAASKPHPQQRLLALNIVWHAGSRIRKTSKTAALYPRYLSNLPSAPKTNSRVRE